MHRTIQYLLTFTICVSVLIGCNKEVPQSSSISNQTTEESVATQSTEEATATQPTEETTATQPTEETTATQPTEETTATQPTEETTATQPTEETIATQPTEETTATQPTEETTATQPTEETTTIQPTEETTAIQPTEETTAIQPTEEIQNYEFCSTCHRWYEGMNLINGQCERCRDGLCFLCNGPDGPNHDCNDYPNVICPNPDCDWGVFTTGVGIDGIICPKCGTRCV